MTDTKTKPARSGLQVAHITILMFSAIIGIGAILLMLPIAHKQPISFIDALFMATSAVCVTGLVTVNVADTFTTFGQTVIMILIELGAIGILTVSTVFLLMLGKSVSLRDSSIVHDSFTASHRINIRRLIKSVVVFLLIFEAAGAALFIFFWSPDMGFKDAAFHGIFLSISAFSNAGISTFAAGMEGFEKDIPTNTVTLILFIAGGIGFMTIAEIYDRAKARFKKEKAVKRVVWSLQIKLVLITTFLSIAIGSVLLLVFEWGNAHAGKPFYQQLMSSVFHVASSRTAGFNNIDLSQFSNPTLYMFILLMFVGGAPISTAGGIKVTTFALLIGMGLSRYRGHERVHLMNRAVPVEVMSRAISIVFIFVLVLIVAMFLLLITESSPGAVAGGARGDFMPILFEAVSAFGTVGLSMGITPDLTVAGKLIITLLMLMGRLGPLTIAMAVGTGRVSRAYQLSEETVMVG
ncbi:MAG: potassium transporter TrkG [Nitrospinota bacterium]